MRTMCECVLAELLADTVRERDELRAESELLRREMAALEGELTELREERDRYRAQARSLGSNLLRESDFGA